MTIAEKIKSLRSETSLSQARFAERYGIPRSTLQHWEQGASTPPPYVLKMLEKMVKELPR